MTNNKSYRIRTDINTDKSKVLNVKIDNDYDILEILSLKFETENLYKLHTSKYGCVVGRVLANGGVGVPNAKISVFIKADEETTADQILSNIYPYTTTADKNSDDIRYNLLPDEEVSQCHQAVGTMPNKRLVLDDNNTLEIFDKYYKFTTATNGAGDYMIMGVPVGNQTIHMDVDLSDIGFLSQKPVDMIYKGYNVSQFENPSMFKKETNLSNLVQIVSQNSTVYVNPFWGDEEVGETISLTRHDINVDYKFEPTCIFMGSVVSESSSNGFSKKCVPTPKMGRMDELTSGSGTIEMIRKTPEDEIESFNVNGTELIDGNGVWCYQIPMNLDYITTDEYGNIVPTDNPEKGIATRASVRFRISLNSFDSDYSNNHHVKVLVPNNPELKEKDNGTKYIDYDYVFGTNTKDDSFRDLLWNNVYTVKSFIPRIQKGHTQRSLKFSGFKNVNVHGKNNPVPYNNMRVNITFMFVLQCAIIKTLIWVIKVYNKFLYAISAIDSVGNALNDSNKNSCLYVGDGLCPDLDGWYFAPGCTNRTNNPSYADVSFRDNTLSRIKDGDAGPNQDPNSIDTQNKEDEAACLTWETDYLIQCIEINLAMENEVIQFDFYNDWINGLVYIPRWFVKIKKKASLFFGLIKTKGGVVACNNESFNGSRHYVQQCAMEYTAENVEGGVMYSKNVMPNGCGRAGLFNKAKCHKSNGRNYIKVLKNGGVVNTHTDSIGGNAYYAIPSEKIDTDKKCNLFATDIILLGSINSNNLWGIPNEFDGMSSSTFQMPPNLAMGNTDVDGIMYGVAGEGNYKCSGGQSNSKSGKTIEKIEYTPTNFNKWVSDVNDKNFDDVTEYAVTELAGIDWGLSGPNQGGIDRGNLFHPGGHFLGIACLNTEVNIKSCVNLSRICELGVYMSQRQSDIVIDGEEMKQEFTIPSGFISKHELSDSNYRNIFATLNHNKLIVDKNSNETIKGYKFINMQPTNFNGELKEQVGFKDGDNYNSKYNALKMDDENDATSPQAYFRTFEESSKDYYNFRLGLNVNEKGVVKNKYLKHYAGDKVCLPVYENSFYFYFGLTDGSTAMDKFLTNYYSACPTDLDKYTPSIEITNVDDAEICVEGGGSVTFKIENISVPYTTIITRGSEIIYFNDFCLIEGDEITVGYQDDKVVENYSKCQKPMSEASYTLTVKNDIQGVSMSKEFQINEIVPTSGDANFNNNSLDITFNLYQVEPEITFTEKTVYIGSDGNEYEPGEMPETVIKVGERNKAGVNVVSAIEEDMTESIRVNKVSAYNNNKSAPYIVGMIIDDGYYYKTTCLYNTDDSDEKKKLNEWIKEMVKYEGFIELEEYTLTYDEVTKHDIFELKYNDDGEKYYSGHINHWGENKYNVRIVYSCEKIIDGKTGKLKTALPILKLYEVIDALTLESTMNLYELWVHDEKNNLSQIDDALVIEGVKKVGSTEAFGLNNKIIFDFDNMESKLNNPFREWTIKKELLYNKSIHEMNGHIISVGVVNGVVPYTETIDGDIEEIKEDKIFIRKRDKSNEREQKISLNNIVLPTKSWMMPYNKEFKDVVELESEGFVRSDYTYSVEDGDRFPALFGIVYKEIGEDNEMEEQEEIFVPFDCEDEW